MTSRTLTVSILLATSFLLLTGCEDKNVSESANEQNPMVETNTNTIEADTAAGNGNDDNYE